MNQAANIEATDANYKSLYKLGGVTAFIAAVLVLAEVAGFAFYPQPGTINGWFTLFASNKLVGLLDFWGLELPLYAMFAIVFPALYFALRKANATLMTIALVFALLGIAIFFATNNPVSMLSLSNQYTAATADAERAALLAAGQTVLTNTNQRAIGGFNIGLFLVSVAGLLVSAVMFQSNSFGRFTAWMGILANGLSLADYLREALTSSAAIALLIILPNTLFLIIWLIQAGRRLYRLGNH